MTAVLAAVLVMIQPPGDRKPGKTQKQKAAPKLPAELMNRPTGTQGPVRVTVVAAKSVKFTPTKDGREQQPQDFLQVDIRIDNLTAYAVMSYHSWSANAPNYGRDSAAVMMTNSNRRVKIADLGFGVRPAGQLGDEIIPRSGSVTDSLVFELPPPDAASVVLLCTPGHIYHGQGENRAPLHTDEILLRIPASSWLKGMSPAKARPSDDDGPPKEPISAVDRSVKITVKRARIEKAKIDTAAEVKESLDPFLVVELDVENLGELTGVEFRGWSYEGQVATAETVEGERLKMIDFGFGHRPVGQLRNFLIKAKGKASTTLVFEPPGRHVRQVNLRLAAAGFHVPGDDPLEATDMTLELPASLWREWYRREDESRNKAIEKAKGKPRTAVP